MASFPLHLIWHSPFFKTISLFTYLFLHHNSLSLSPFPPLLNRKLLEDGKDALLYLITPQYFIARKRLIMLDRLNETNGMNAPISREGH